MTALTTREATILADHEQVVERGLSTFLDVGRALLVIRDERLYRDEHDTFESYCRDRWGMSDRHARHLMEAAAVGTMVPVENERQARELAPLLDQPEALRDAWQQANDQTAGKPTAAAIRSVVRPQPSPPAAIPAGPTVSLRPTVDAAPPSADGEPQSVPAPEPVKAPPQSGEIATGAGTPDLTGVAFTREQFVARRDAGQEMSVEDWRAQQEPDDLPAPADAVLTDDEKFRSNLVKALSPSYSVLSLRPERVVETYQPGSNAAEALDLYLSRITAWTEQVRRGLRPTLRSVR